MSIEERAVNAACELNEVTAEIKRLRRELEANGETFYALKAWVEKNTRMQALELQEEVVGVLWDFAWCLQNKPHDAKNSAGTSVSLSSVGEACERIMTIFGEEPVEVE